MPSSQNAGNFVSVVVEFLAGAKCWDILYVLTKVSGMISCGLPRGVVEWERRSHTFLQQ